MPAELSGGGSAGASSGDGVPEAQPNKVTFPDARFHGLIEAVTVAVGGAVFVAEGGDGAHTAKNLLGHAAGLGVRGLARGGGIRQELAEDGAAEDEEGHDGQDDERQFPVLHKADDEPAQEHGKVLQARADLFADAGLYQVDVSGHGPAPSS